MNCRFCFRQHYPYETEDKSYALELKRLADDPSIQELILSGGDPLSLSNRVLGELFEGLNKIPHIKRLRFHTRFPIGIPERIDGEFLELLQSLKSQVWFVIHCNHPKELDDEIFASLAGIQKLGIPVLCSTVLLKEINDDVETLHALCERLIDRGVLPYYLHQMDRVKGAAHFEVDEKIGLELIQELEKRLPGFGVPKFVREVAGAASKTPITSSPAS